jgi:two-component system cell cycle response regulator
VMFDIDHFKRCNDTYGHRGGDYVLHGVAQLVQERARKLDFVARYGGEEFAIIITEFDPPYANLFAEDIRVLVQNQHFEFEGHVIPITISVGLVTWSPRFDGAGQLIEAADQCLYQAKASGRNRVVAAVDDTTLQER